MPQGVSASSGLTCHGARWFGAPGRPRTGEVLGTARTGQAVVIPEREGVTVQHDELIGQVRYRARLASGSDAERAVRAALHTLGECIPEELADSLAAQLPREIGEYLYLGVPNGERFDRQEFVARVAARAGTRQQHAACLARTVFEVIDEAVQDEVMLKVAGSLPDDIAELLTADNAD